MTLAELDEAVEDSNMGKEAKKELGVILRNCIEEPWHGYDEDPACQCSECLRVD